MRQHSSSWWQTLQPWGLALYLLICAGVGVLIGVLAVALISYLVLLTIG